MIEASEEASLLTLEEFSARLAAKTSVPGGGGAAALVAALAAALGEMVAHFTTGKAKYLPVESKMQEILKLGGQLRAASLQLIDQDAAAFTALAAAYKLPKEDPRRSAQLEQASVEACQAPLNVMRVSAQLAPLLTDLMQSGNRMLLSDVGAAAWLALAAAETAVLNVWINVKALKDASAAAHLTEQANQLLGSCRSSLGKITHEIEQALIGDI